MDFKVIFLYYNCTSQREEVIEVQVLFALYSNRVEERVFSVLGIEFKRVFVRIAFRIFWVFGFIRVLREFKFFWCSFGYSYIGCFLGLELLDRGKVF